MKDEQVQGDRNVYAVRMLSIPEDSWHECVSQIVAVLQSSYNPQRRVWYITALIQRSPFDVERFGIEDRGVDGIPEADAAPAGG